MGLTVLGVGLQWGVKQPFTWRERKGNNSKMPSPSILTVAEVDCVDNAPDAWVGTLHGSPHHQPLFLSHSQRRKQPRSGRKEVAAQGSHPRGGTVSLAALQATRRWKQGMKHIETGTHPLFRGLVTMGSSVALSLKYTAEQ